MHYKRQHRYFIIINCLLLIALLSDVHAMDRRRDQFSREPGHYVIPMPYSLPGIGEGFLLAGTVNNVHDSYTDYIGFIIAGDLEGAGAIVKDVHLVDRTLILDVYAQVISKVSIRNYNGRGMASSKDDYSLMELKDNQFAAARLTMTSDDRMFEISGAVLQAKQNMTSLRDKDGNLIENTSNSETQKYQSYTAAIQFDWTDDYLDPRRGVRYNFSRWWRDEAESYASDFYQQEHNLTGYIPIGRISTLALNYFRSDAHVTRIGDTDFASVESRSDLNCSNPEYTAEQTNNCNQVVNNTIAQNQYGTVGGVGGWQRLRSYPNDRFKGGHVLFYGAELRWNLTEEFKPFDIGIAKDIRTGIQLAFFYETATVADEKAQLGDVWRDSYGMGMRMVTASGLVVRADVATGDEGEELSVIVGYPWEGF